MSVEQRKKQQYAGRYPLEASVWFRESTGEWILEITGTINDTGLTARHTAPAHMDPENVPGLPHLYEKLKVIDDLEEIA